MSEKTIEQLRASVLHQQLGRKLCIAFVAQQQRVSFSTAAKNISDDQPIGDLWLQLAEQAYQGFSAHAEKIMSK